MHPPIIPHISLFVRPPDPRAPGSPASFAPVVVCSVGEVGGGEAAERMKNH